MSNTRAEFRRRKRHEAKQNKTYTMTMAELESMKRRNLIEGTDYAFMLLLSIPLKVMHEKYGWSEDDELPEFCEALTDEYQRFVDSDYDIPGYIDYVEEITGGRFIKDV